MLPIVPPSLPEFEPEESGEPVGPVEPERLRAPDEPHDAGAGYTGISLQGAVGNAALDDRLSESVGNQ
jgi:hypothetical protein